MLKNPRYLYFSALVIIISALAGIDSFLSGTRAQSGNPSAARQTKDIIKSPNQIDTSDSAGVFIVTMVNGVTSCRRVSTEEERTLLRGDRNTPMHVISPLPTAARGQSQILLAQTGLKIILRATAQFENFNVKPAFLRAAAHWEQVVKTPITVIIDVDFGPTRFGTPFPAGVLGATSAQTITGSYPNIRNGLINGATNQSEMTLYSVLPTGTVPTDSGATSSVTATSANLRALGLLSPIADPDTEANLGAPPAIGFNSSFSFDVEPNNGIDTGLIDFDAVVTHEIGHVLGFISNVGSKELT